MLHAYAVGLRAALRRWPVVLVLFGANLALGAAFTAAASVWLWWALDASVVTRTLLTDLDWGVFVDLLVHHSQSLRMLLLGGVLLAIPAMLLSVWLNAVAVAAVGEDGSIGACMQRGLTLYPTFLGLSLLANGLGAASIAAGWLIGRALMRWSAESTSELSVYWAGGAGALVAGVVVLLALTVHDHARVRSTATGTGALRAFAWALRFVTRRERRALPLAVLLLATGLVVWVVYQYVAMLVPTTSTPGVVLSLLWGQALLLSRMLVRIWSFAAATELQSLRD